jgi:hypothetical protein
MVQCRLVLKIKIKKDWWVHISMARKAVLEDAAQPKIEESVL